MKSAQSFLSFPLDFAIQRNLLSSSNVTIVYLLFSGFSYRENDWEKDKFDVDLPNSLSQFIELLMKIEISIEN